MVLNATGYIVAHHEIQVASKVSGKVAWIGVDEGSAVKKGEVSFAGRYRVSCPGRTGERQSR